ncbi:YcaO-like family protein [Nonomuraea sp. NPDC004354]
MSLADSLGIIESLFRDAGLSVELVSAGTSEFPVHRCSVLAPSGEIVAESLGKGRGEQSRASALFEAWQHLQHERGQAALPFDTERVRVLPVAAVLDQEGIGGDEMLARLGRDFPSASPACLLLEPLTGGRPLWYPAFTRSPACREHPIPGDDLRGYVPYLRYAYDSGTATGVTENEAVLHGLLEVVERDALSHALLDWYLGDGPIAAVPHEAALVLDITSDLGIPAYCALPVAAGDPPGVLGSGASLDPAYAIERAVTELAQSRFNMSLGVDLTLERRLESLRPWPLLDRCARVDPAPLRERLTYTGAPPDAPATAGVEAQIALVLDTLAAAGLSAYLFRWNPGGPGCPVVTVVVPGMDTFSMVHNAIPVLPTGRAMRRLV